MTWHAHYNSWSRDCDGRYDYGYDIPAQDDDIQTRAKDDLDLIDLMLSLLWRPSSDETGPFMLKSDIDDQGRTVLEASQSSIEGGWSATVVICDQDDYDPDYNRYRDHSAERAGY